MRRFLIRLAPILSVFAVAITSASAQTITITTMNGTAVPPDELFISQSGFPTFTVEWEASAFANPVSVLVDNQPVFCDGECSGTSGAFDLPNLAGCRHTIQLVGTFFPGGNKRSQTVAWWSSEMPPCVETPKPCDEGIGQVAGPVDVATGRMYYEMTDLVIQGPLPIPRGSRGRRTSARRGSRGVPRGDQAEAGEGKEVPSR
jgi:hypothetical protein